MIGRRNVRIPVFRYQQLNTYPEQQRCADKLEVGVLEQRNGKDRQHNTHEDGGARTPGDGLLLLVRRQRPGRQGDHHRIVPRQHDVHDNDLEQRNPEILHCERDIHDLLFLYWMSIDKPRVFLHAAKRGV